MKKDPAIDEIRKVRHQISASVDHDPKKLVKYYQDLQKRHSNRLLSQKQTDTKTQPGNAA